MFNDELLFEKAIVELLQKKGWSAEVLVNKTEKDLLDNWAKILYENNKGIDRLNNVPLNDEEMQQLIDKIRAIGTPFGLNKFINGKTMSITRKNPKDPLHLDKEISLDIYDRDQIAGGKSVYQIVRQPRFVTKSSMLNNRRGDLMLLINGMPVIHIELKKSGIPVSQAVEQIKKYSHEGAFTGIFSLIQVFVAMTPEETLYFANPGPDKFNDKFYFHWADYNNVRYDENKNVESWDKIIENLLSIPMAHKLIGFYTVPDDGDGILKVLRSYQYYAVEAINNRVSKAQWTSKDKLGGYICHTTGSGKTLTSFKAAQLLASSGKADKVVFLVDRIELGTQSALEYKNFKSDNEEVQETETTHVLISKLKSSYADDTLIVTSIQKMSNIKFDEGVNQRDIENIRKKKIVFIIDECHRSTFGEMLADIKETFPTALYFGFTGTPIYDENQKHMNTTNTVFGTELHRYSISDGIKDNNVLGFDPYKIITFEDKKIRRIVALEQSKSSDESEAFSDDRKKEKFLYYMNQCPMAGYYNDNGEYIKGIEDFIPQSQYQRNPNKSIEKRHQYRVVKHILENWLITSVDSKFHAIFATSSIKEACEYYQLFKDMMGKNGLPILKIAGIFDETIGNNELAIPKEDALVEILNDYNESFKCTYRIPTYKGYKKDVILRLSHKEKYLGIEKRPEELLDLVIVVDQLLTGFDSKWINTLYLDKKIRFEGIVQAFSRTNRLFGKDKPYGIVKYYRYPHTMERNIRDAFELYSGKKEFGVFVEKLEQNLNIINSIFTEIKYMFNDSGIFNFERNPDSLEEKKKFAILFSKLCRHIVASRIQGFNWNVLDYTFEDENGTKSFVNVILDEKTYQILGLRYKELFNFIQGNNGLDIPYDIDSIAIEIDTEKIDADYLNSKFKKYVKALQEQGVDAYLVEIVLDELHRSFASLSQEDQFYAESILNDIKSGILYVEEDKTLRDYINEYKSKQKNDEIHRCALLIGVNEDKLRSIMNLRPNSSNINEFGIFDELMSTLDIEVAKKYFDLRDNKNYPKPLIKVKADELIRKFIISGGFEI